MIATWMLCAVLQVGAPAPQQPEGAGSAGPHDARQLYEAGRYEDAAAAFRLQANVRPQSAELQYNLAVSLWRAGQLAAAEEAAERYAAMPGGGREDLYRGLIGNVRYSEAVALRDVATNPHAPVDPVSGGGPAAASDPVAVLEQALQKAERSRDEFVHGAAAPGAGPALGRNVERALRLVAELEELLEQAREQQQQQQQSDDQQQDQQQKQDQQQDQQQKQDQQQDQNQKPQDQKQEQQDQKQEPQAPDQQSTQQPQEGHERPEPQQQPEQQPEQQQQESPRPEPSQEPQQDPQQQPEEGAERPEPQQADPGAAEQPQPSGQRGDAPGEHGEGMRLSPEQQQRLLEELDKLDKQLQQIRAQARSRRPAVRRDW